MTSEPVWVPRVNYRAVPTRDEKENECETFNSSDRKFRTNEHVNDKSPPEKGGGGITNNNYKDNTWTVGTEKRITGIQNVAAIESCKRVVINVSGMKFETYESTLARLPESLLGSPTKRAPHYRSTCDEFYFNRNKIVFDSILFYYQSGATNSGILVKPDGIPNETFEAEVKFFELGHDAEMKIGLETRTKEHEGFYDAAVMSRCHSCSSKIGKLFEPNSTGKSSPFHRVIDVWAIFITVFFVVLLCSETLPPITDALTLDQCCNQTEASATVKNHQISFFWSFSKKCCISWFTLEYIIRAFCAFDKTAYLLSAQGVFDVLSFLPCVIQTILRESIYETETIVLQRILVFLMFFSVFKLTRYSMGLQILLKTIHSSIRELTLLMVCVLISLVLFSSVVYYCETSDQSTTFTSIPGTFWFIIVTMTTVGYGDMAPITVAGKIFSALCAVFGVCCVLAIPSTIIVTNFNYFYIRQKRKLRKPKRPKTRTTGLQKWVTRFRTVSL